MAATDHQLFALIGLYFVHWSSFELAVDIGISKLSGRPPQETLKMSRGWTVSRKVKHLKEIATRSSHEHRGEIINVLDALPKESLRNIIAHCYMRFGMNSVVFLQRDKTGKLTRVQLSTAEFEDHLQLVARLAHSLSEGLNNTDDDADKHYQALLTD
jgi:hypothetical protein